MRRLSTRGATALLFILGAVLVNVPYAILIATFDYPDILREPAGTVLVRFQAGGSGLILTWLAFAWAGFPILLALGLLHRVLVAADGEDRHPYLGIATAIGVAGAVTQMVGLLRWVFVVPALAGIYTDTASSQTARDASVVTFEAVHQYGGVLIGEHLGQAFTQVWMVLIGVALLRSRSFPTWLGAMGIASAAVYALGHAELIATAIPGFPYWGLAGLVGSLLWLAWLVALGVYLLLPGREARPQAAPGGMVAGSAPRAVREG